jgi:hypothetical protein
MGALYVGELGRARSHSIMTKGAEAVPRWDPSTSCPRSALNMNYGAPEPLSSRTGSVAHALVVPDSVNLRRQFEPIGGQASFL